MGGYATSLSMVIDRKRCSESQHSKLNQFIQQAEKNTQNRCYLAMEKKTLPPNLKFLISFESLKEMELILNLKLDYSITNLKDQLFVFVKKVDKSFSKFFINSFPWLPQIKSFRDCLDYWCCIVKQKLNVIKIKTIINRFIISTGEYSGYFVTISKAVD